MDAIRTFMFAAPTYEQKKEILNFSEKGLSDSYYTYLIEAPIQGIKAIAVAIFEIPTAPVKGLIGSVVKLSEGEICGAIHALIDGIAISVRSMIQIAVIVTAVVCELFCMQALYQILQEENSSRDNTALEIDPESCSEDITIQKQIVHEDSSIEASSSQIEALQLQFRNAEAEITKTSQQLPNQILQEENSSRDNTALEIDPESCSEDITIQKQIVHENSSIEASRSQIEALQLQLRNAEAEITKTSQQLPNQILQEENSSRDNTALEIDPESCSEDITIQKQIVHEDSSIEASSSQIEALQLQLRNAEAEITKTSQQLPKNEEEKIKEIDTLISEQKKIFEEKENELTERASKISRLEQQIEDNPKAHQRTIAFKERTIEEDQRQVFAANQLYLDTNKDAEEYREKLETSLAELEEQDAALKRLDAAYVTAQKHVKEVEADYQGEISELQVKIKRLQEEIKEKEQLFDEKFKEIIQAKELIETNLKSNLEKLEKFTKLNDDLGEQNRNLMSQLTAAKKLIAKLKKAIVAIQKIKPDLSKIIKQSEETEEKDLPAKEDGDLVCEEDEAPNETSKEEVNPENAGCLM